MARQMERKLAGVRRINDRSDGRSPVPAATPVDQDLAWATYIETAETAMMKDNKSQRKSWAGDGGK
jgi:hypothetical protein